MQHDGRTTVGRRCRTRDHFGQLVFIELGKRLISAAFCHQRRRFLAQPLQRAPTIKRHVRAPCNRRALKRRRARRIVAQLGHGHNRKLQALAGVHRHDAHEIAAFGRQRTRRLFRQLNAKRQLGGHTRRPLCAIGLDIARHANGLVHVARARHALGAGGFKARQPPRVGHDARHDVGKRHVTHLLGCPTHQVRARHQRRRHVAPRGNLALHAAEPLVKRTPARNATLLVEAGGQLQQIVGRKREQLARQHLEQRRRPFRVRHGLRQAHHQRHLRRSVENGPARHHARQPFGTQRRGIIVRTAHAAQQHHHVAVRMSRRGVFRKRTRNAPRRNRGCLVGGNPAVRHAGNLHLNARPIRQKRPLDLRFRASRRKRHEASAEHLRLREHAVAQRQHIAVAAEVVGQLDDALRIARAHVLQMSAIHRHVRPAEPINALLRVANGAHAREALARHALDHVHLQLVGVLELVHHHQLEAVRIRRLNSREIAKRPCRERQQVVVVQKPRLAFAARKRLGHQLR